MVCLNNITNATPAHRLYFSGHNLRHFVWFGMTSGRLYCFHKNQSEFALQRIFPESFVSSSKYQQFVNGNHAVSHSKQPFAQVWTDMALEQSINADSKPQGGIIGITKSPAAFGRWFLACHERALITTTLKDMYAFQDSDRVGTLCGCRRRRFPFTNSWYVCGWMSSSISIGIFQLRLESG